MTAARVIDEPQTPTESQPAPPAERRAAEGPPGMGDVLRLLRPYRGRMTLAFVLGSASTVFAALQPRVVASAVDGFDGGIRPVTIGLLVTLLILSAVFTNAQQLVMERSGELFAFHTRERVIRHLFTLPIGVLERRERADLVSRVTTDTSQLRMVMSSGIVELATSVVAVLVSVVMMALIDWALLALAVVTIVVALVVIVVIGRRTAPAGLRLQTAMGTLAGAVTRGLGSMRTIRATVSTDREVDVAVGEADAVLKAGYAAATLRAAIQTFAAVTIQALLLAIIAVGAMRVAAGTLTVGDLSAFIMYLMLMAAPITLCAGIFAQLGEAFGSLHRVLEVQAIEGERDVDVPPGMPLPDASAPAAFELVDVSFRYPQGPDDEAPGDDWVLRGVSIQLRAGETTAVVGPSGAGKSTLFALLERFYEPTQGSVRFRDEDVRRLSRVELRRQIAYVEQDAPVLSGTVRDNLVLGAPGASTDQCIDALRQVNLPRAGDAAAFLACQVGEGGELLSGGERQRLAIARALLADSPVLLLDEVTSNLDSNNERIVRDLVASVGGRSIVVIAHRLSTVVAADAIIVLDQGRVVAQGTHRELMDSCPLYRELAGNQLLA
ncbi:ABC transporter ATP-binding protein [Cellulomonas sp. zg-ZUI222]|uniref:ABC transporter ATP-binding protein n=1 Tax=Cellulomonas wangleii TaxID=2816956 RepID=A0ABX8D5N1_9CELL|nr:MULTISPECIES: ABC transporter ATP-binding protein [Cellulomonas]MBO0901795.1 ABC transporter ATP-binding protein [Cellulomonas sp. zg-ZUI22]MBO0922034.1 ABC transporter ATP-binding protein [Cellulomonas wangleii]MBO0926248.1 ABC transporter ATP-binding protein [Cellulomonas wangleii]QVI62754.1 ABC transporter ATP-binding protein [Cellulomonas wangleii]